MQSINLIVEAVFNTNGGQQRQTTQPTRGVGVIVTPDPTYVPTTAPQTLTVNQQNCTCVPYHLCDPITNTVRETPNEDEVTGFGKIDIRFDPLDCVDVLDVCCVGVAQREESIVPKPNENVPTQEAGCGVRNVGGLDFELAGAFVSVSMCCFFFKLFTVVFLRMIIICIFSCLSTQG